VLEILRENAKNFSLFGFEIPTKVFLTDEEFTTENGLLTPTLKPSREALRKFY